jgi:hypothetical protein
LQQTFFYYQEHKILEIIKKSSRDSYDYVLSIDAAKWRSKERRKNKKLPPQYGIVSTNISESSNSMCEEAHNLPWLHCLDHILNKMSSRISLLREANRDNAGVVPFYTAKIEESWKNSAGSQILQLEGGILCYKVTRLAVNNYQTIHVLRVTEWICSCGRWQEFGNPCQDAMVYFWVIKKKTIVDVMDSDVVVISTSIIFIMTF